MEPNKETLRRAMRAQRAALDAATVRLAGSRIAARLAGFPLYVQADAVLAYVELGNEVPTGEIVDDAMRRGQRVFVPLRRDESFVELTSGDAGAGPAGADGARYPAEGLAGVVLVPLVAWSDSGERLGRGGGWYDRILPRLGLPKIGVGYAFQERPHVPTEPWDVRLDFVVTESRLVECGGVLSAGRLS